MQKKQLVQKTFGAYRAPRVDFPDLVGHQRESFQWLLEDGLKELFKEFSPIPDYSGKKFELRFDGFEIGSPKGTEEEARENMRTYEAPIKASVTLVNKTFGSEKTQEIFLTDIPMMTAMSETVSTSSQRPRRRNRVPLVRRPGSRRMSSTQVGCPRKLAR